MQAIGIFHTTAMRRSALTSGSCGWGSNGVPEEDQEIDFVVHDPGADLLVASQGTAFEPDDLKAQHLFKDLPGCARCKYLVMRQEVTVGLADSTSSCSSMIVSLIST